MLFHCDFVVAGSDASFSTPFVSLGLIPEAASSLLAPRLMGQRRAFEFLIMGHPLNAMQAREFGIANIVVAPEDVDAEALKAAREIAALPAGAVALSLFRCTRARALWGLTRNLRKPRNTVRTYLDFPT
jgi:enoyl-CoA hydratase/carnithine racemase